MRLTAFTEYSLRVLVHLARYPDRFVRIKDIAVAEGISANHLMKVAQHLAATGDVVTLRGPRGGLRLGRPPEAILLGDIVRRTEPDMGPGLGSDMGSSDLHPVQQMITEATDAFMAVLNRLSVADLAFPRESASR